MIPILNPCDSPGVSRFRSARLRVSRFSGCWVGLKAVAETRRELGLGQHRSRARRRSSRRSSRCPPGGLCISAGPTRRWSSERRLHGPKMAAVAAFVRANAIDRLVLDPQARTARHHHRRQGLSRRSPGARRSRARRSRTLAALGIRLLQGRAHVAARGGGRAGASPQASPEVLVVEEKRGFIEDQLVRVSTTSMQRAGRVVVGKCDEHGATTCFPSEGGDLVDAGGDEPSSRGSLGLADRRVSISTRGSPASRRPSSVDYGVACLRAHAVLLFGMSAQHVDARCRKVAARSPGSVATGWRR